MMALCISVLRTRQSSFLEWMCFLSLFYLVYSIIGMYQILEANQKVEEFMLAANISVAEKILKHFPMFSLLKRHPSPTKEMLEPCCVLRLLFSHLFSSSC